MNSTLPTNIVFNYKIIIIAIIIYLVVATLSRDTFMFSIANKLYGFIFMVFFLLVIQYAIHHNQYIAEDIIVDEKYGDLQELSNTDGKYVTLTEGSTYFVNVGNDKGTSLKEINIDNLVIVETNDKPMIVRNMNVKTIEYKDNLLTTILLDKEYSQEISTLVEKQQYKIYIPKNSIIGDV